MTRQLLCTALVSSVLVLSTPGCSGSPVAPTATRPASTPDNPTTPGDPSTPTDPAPQTWTISGTVWVYGPTGVAPASGGSLSAWVENGLSGYSDGTRISATGRYELHVATGTTWVSVFGGPGYQPCAVGLSPKGNSTMDIARVVDPQRLGANLPPELLLNTPTLSGLVYEQTPSGRRPIAGAWLGLDGLYGDGVVTATTLTDANGRYVLCGVPQRERTALWVEASSFQRPFAFEEFAGQSTFDVDLTH